MNILVIDGHPDPAAERLCHVLATRYAEAATDAGHAVRRIDVHTLAIDFLRSQKEYEKTAAPAWAAAAQEDLLWSEHVLLVYPLWLGTMPALLKAFLEQVLRPDFAFDYKASDKAEARLKGRSARIVVTMGMPAVAYRWWFFAHSLKSLERNILKFTGMGPVRHTLLGGVAAADEAKRRSWFDAMAALGRQAR